MYFHLSLSDSMVGLQEASTSLEEEPTTHEKYLLILKLLESTESSRFEYFWKLEVNV